MSRRESYTRTLPPRVINQFRRVIDSNNQLRSDGKGIASEATREARANRIMSAMADLWDLGFRIQKPESLAPKHIAALMSHWDRQGDSPGLLHTKLANLRTFASWVGKGEEVVGHMSIYLPKERTERTVATTEDKSWQGKGVDPVETGKMAYAIDERFGAMLEAGRHFGLRTKESILLNPKKALVRSGDAIFVEDGTKGGYRRLVQFRNPEQKACFDRLLKIASKDRAGTLAWPGLTWKQAQNRFYVYAKKLKMTKAGLGVTMHGQRVGFTSDDYEHETGYLPPIKGGVPVKPGLPKKIDRELHKRGALRVSNQVGHHRVQVGGSYFGSYGHALRPTKADAAGSGAGSVSLQGDGGSSPLGDCLSIGCPPGQMVTYAGHRMILPV